MPARTRLSQAPRSASARARGPDGRYLAKPKAPEGAVPETSLGDSPLGAPSDAFLAERKLSREVAEYMLDRGYALPEPWQAPLYKTPEPGDYPEIPCWFEPARVDKVISSFRHLQHTKGKWAGRPLDPDNWQVAYILAPVFGWVMINEDDADEIVRVVRETWVEVSRKNGKSTLIGGVGIYMTCADGERGAEAIAAASTKDQARFVFGPVKSLAEHSPALKPHVRAYTNKIVHKATASEFAVVSSVADAQHGANIHFGCCDEVHIQPNPDLIETIETGTGSRSQPLIFLITTADEGKPDTIYVRKRNLVTSICKNTIRKASTYGVIWAAAEDEESALRDGLDLYSEEALKRANPGYGVSPTRSYLKEQAELARQSPSDRSKFLRLHLGIRTKQSTTYIGVDAWDRSMSLANRAELIGQSGYGGLDLASTSDFTAWCVLIPHMRGGLVDGTFSALWRFWIPEGGYQKLIKRTANNVDVWRRQGWITVTDGDVADYDEIQAGIEQDAKDYQLAEIGYDPWNATQLTVNLAKKLGAKKLVEVRQGTATLSPPLKDLKRLIYLGQPEAPTIRHGGNPVVRWMLGNLAVVEDAQGNVKPDRKSSNDKIDGFVALLIAYARAMPGQAVRRSAYADRGLTVAR